MQLRIHLKKSQQQLMPLFNGAFLENKPIPFPDRGETTAYSNLFYWAHLEAFETSEFPLHPHEGFEIITFVFKGSIEHYDTATKVWTPLDAGGVQVIQAGSGVQHAERITKGTRLFQIWFDPDFSKTLTDEASYVDHPASNFIAIQDNGIEKLSYFTDKGPLTCESKGVQIEKLNFGTGEFTHDTDSTSTYSYYLLNGEMKINDIVLEKDDFIVFDESENVHFSVKYNAELFIIKSPSTIHYRRFIERYASFTV